MLKPSAYEIALVFGGFILCMIILNAMGYGNHPRPSRSIRRRRRIRRRYDDYDDDDDDYDEDDEHHRNRRGSGCLIIAALVVFGIAAISRTPKTDMLQSVTNYLDTTKHIQKGTSKSSLIDSSFNDEIPELSFNETFPLTPEDSVSATVAEQLPQEPETTFYIRVHVLFDPLGIDNACRTLKKRGFEVSTMPKGSGTAIFVGPYESREKAEQVNDSKNLKGFIEEY